MNDDCGDDDIMMGMIPCDREHKPDGGAECEESSTQRLLREWSIPPPPPPIRETPSNS